MGVVMPKVAVLQNQAIHCNGFGTRFVLCLGVPCPPPIFCCDRSAVSVPLAGTDRPDGRTVADAQSTLELWLRVALVNKEL